MAEFVLVDVWKRFGGAFLDFRGVFGQNSLSRKIPIRVSSIRHIVPYHVTSCADLNRLLVGNTYPIILNTKN